MADPDHLNRSHIHRASMLVRCMITTLILLFIALTAASVLSWLILHPRLPKFHIDSFSLSNLTLFESKLVADYDLTFTAKNPNWKINMLFHCLDVSIEYKKCKLASSQARNLSLWKMDETKKKLELGTNAGNTEVGRGHVEEMRQDLKRKEVVFDVRMRGWTTLRCGKWISKNKWVQVDCKDLRTVFPSSDYKVNATWKLIDGGVDCSVSWLDQ